MYMYTCILNVSQQLLLYYFFSVYHVQNGWTPLMSASLNGHVEIVKTLIGSQAQVNTQKEV